MQAASDIFLGWTAEEENGHNYYVRQMWDMKGSVDIEPFNPKQLLRYAESCGWTLARAHFRTGSASAISGYLGNQDTFDLAIAKYAVSYADLAEIDYAAFRSKNPQPYPSK